MNGKERQHILELIQIHQENLWVAETQAAHHGIITPVHLINEIKFARQHIEELKGILKKIFFVPLH